MKKAIFLDRDGVINREQGYVKSLEDFEILPGLIEALKYFRDKGYLLFIVSNQSGIAKGLYTVADVEVIHEYLEKELSKHNVHFAAIYYCIHHPETTRCICRKPDSLFLEKAMARFSIDPEQSYFIGDKERDFQAGQKAGVTAIQVEENTPLTYLYEFVK